MTTVHYGESSIAVDICPACKGMWLDKEEYGEIVRYLESVVDSSSTGEYLEDMREELVELLKARGAKVDYNDPYIPTTHKQREHDLRMKSVPVTPASLKRYDCVVISTDHDAYDYGMIAKNARLVVDTRNACAKVKGAKRNVFKA